MKTNVFDLSKITTVATDLDGTALNKDHKIDEITVEVLDRLVEKGIRVIVATGRPYEDVRTIFKNARHKFTMVTSNGAMLNNAAPCPDKSYFIPKDIVDEIVNIKIPDRVLFNVFTESEWFVNYEDAEIKKYFCSTDFNYSIINYDTLDCNNIVKAFFIDVDCPMDPHYKSDELTKLFDKFNAKYADRFDCCFSQVNCLEINDKGINKLKGVNEYLSYFGDVAHNNLIAFGDGMNDFQLLSESRHAFIMGNADPTLVASLSKSPNAQIVGRNSEFTVARILNQLFDLGIDELEPYFTDTDNLDNIEDFLNK